MGVTHHATNRVAMLFLRRWSSFDNCDPAATARAPKRQARATVLAAQRIDELDHARDVATAEIEDLVTHHQPEWFDLARDPQAIDLTARHVRCELGAAE